MLGFGGSTEEVADGFEHVCCCLERSSTASDGKNSTVMG